MKKAGQKYRYQRQVNVCRFKSQDISAKLTSVDLKRKAILALTGVNLAVNLALYEHSTGAL